MIDLHLHLDGSLSLDDFDYLAKKQNVDLGKDFPSNVMATNAREPLEVLLKRFDIPLMLMQDEESISYCVTSLINRLYKDGYIYIEIRFAPQLHKLKGLNQEQVVKASIKGLKDGLKDKTGFDANLILCCMRHGSEEENLETVLLADKYRNEKICGVDMAGQESLYPADHYQKIFDEAYKRKLNITIHAGESTGSDEVVNVVKLLHATRVGHGVHLIQNEENVALMKKYNVGFEVCPTSNIETMAEPDYEHCPIKEFIKNGLLVNLNSDDMTVCDVTLLEEYQHIYQTFKLSKDEVKFILNNAAKMSFASDEVKKMITKEIDNKIDWYYSLITK